MHYSCCVFFGKVSTTWEVDSGYVQEFHENLPEGLVCHNDGTPRSKESGGMNPLF